MFGRKKHREDLFRKTLEAFLRVFPKADEIDTLQAWSTGLRFLLELQRRQESDHNMEITADERDRLRLLCTWYDGHFGNPGMLMGFALHDCSDAVLQRLLGDAEHAARKLAKELKAL